MEDTNLISRTKLWRIESGKAPVKVPDVRALCWFYGASPEQTDALATQALGTTQQGWWEEYGEAVPEWFRLYIGLEGAAERIRTYDPELVPGPFQTEEYARAIFAVADPEPDADTVGRLVELRRNRRRALLEGPHRPRIDVVLSAGVLARQVGGPEVMAAQVAALREFDALDHVAIRVLGWAAGAHLAMLGAFCLLDFEDDEDPSFVYLETQISGRYLEKEADVAAYRRVFDRVWEQATPLAQYKE